MLGTSPQHSGAERFVTFDRNWRRAQESWNSTCREGACWSIFGALERQRKGVTCYHASPNQRGSPFQQHLNEPVDEIGECSADLADPLLDESLGRRGSIYPHFTARGILSFLRGRFSFSSV